MTITPLARISVDDPGSPIPVDGNFQLIENYVNTELLNRDGSIAVTPGNVLTQETEPTQDSHVANKRYVDNAVPTGVIQMFAGNTPPTGWLICDGTNLSSTDPAYADLYALIGTSFGTLGGDDFNLPDMRQNVAVGKGTDTEFDTIGKTGGDANGVAAHTHNQTAHTHSMNNHTHGSGSLSTNSTGSHNHNVNPPNTTSTSSGSHSHNVFDRSNALASGSSGFPMRSNSSGTDTTRSTSTAGSHTHNVNIAAFDSGNAGSHSHNVNSGVTGANNEQTGTGTSNGSTDPTESTGTDKGNYQPFVVLNYIIKL